MPCNTVIAQNLIIIVTTLCHAQLLMPKVERKCELRISSPPGWLEKEISFLHLFQYKTLYMLYNKEKCIIFCENYHIMEAAMTGNVVP